jgi:hypothetical protein
MLVFGRDGNPLLSPPFPLIERALLDRLFQSTVSTNAGRFVTWPDEEKLSAARLNLDSCRFTWLRDETFAALEIPKLLTATWLKKVSDNSISPAPTAVNDMITNNAYAACKADQSHSLLYHPF